MKNSTMRGNKYNVKSLHKENFFNECIESCLVLYELCERRKNLSNFRSKERTTTAYVKRETQLAKSMRKGKTKRDTLVVVGTFCIRVTGLFIGYTQMWAVLKVSHLRNFIRFVKLVKMWHRCHVRKWKNSGIYAVKRMQGKWIVNLERNERIDR